MGRFGRALRRILHTRPCVWAIRTVLPRLHLPTRGLPDEKIAEGRKHLRLADVLLSKSPLGIPAMLTAGFDHAAMYLDSDTVGEMVGTGFQLVTWQKFCKHARRVLILRCDDFRRYESDEEYPTKVALECLAIGRTHKYDYQFETGDEELTCAELPVEADFEGRMSITFGKAWGTGHRFVGPQHILDADNMTVIFDSKGQLSGKAKH